MNIEEFDLGYVARDYRLSVCIPTFNRGEFIGQTLRSILKQLDEGVEVIIFDGGSSDSTSAVVTKACEGTSQVRYFRQEENGGIDRDMAKSVELSSAPYCWLFSSDDLMVDGAINKICALIEVSLSDIILCGMTLCDSNMIPICDHHIWSAVGNRTYDLGVEESRQQYLKNSLTTTALFSFLGNIIFKRRIWDQGTNSEAYIGSCWAHVARFISIIPQGLKVYTFQESLVLNRGGNDSFSQDGRIARMALSIDGFLRIFQSGFGENALETHEIIRILNYEWPFHAYANAYDSIQRSNQKDRTELMRLLSLTRSSSSAKPALERFILRQSFLRKMFIAMVAIKHNSKRIINLLGKRSRCEL